MSPLADGYFKVANVNSPLTASTSNSLLRDADPGLYYLLEFYKGIISIHMGARWNAETTAAGRTDLNNIPVAEVVPFDPIPYMAEEQLKFPLLAAFRKSESYTWLTSAYYNIISKVTVLWIMPPVNAGQAERLMPFRTHVARTLVDRTSKGFDSFYNNGQEVWALSGLNKIGVESCSYGTIPTDTNLVFPTVMLEIELTERDMPTSEPGLNFAPFTGVDLQIEVDDDIE